MGTIFSQTFKRTSRITIGRKSSFFIGVSFFGIREILDTFQVPGNIVKSILLLIIFVRGPAKVSATSLMYLAGILSGPVEQSHRRFLITR